MNPRNYPPAVTRELRTERPYNYSKRELSQSMLEQAKLFAERKQNGHLISCVCRSCFEQWQREQEPLRAELRRLSELRA